MPNEPGQSSEALIVGLDAAAEQNDWEAVNALSEEILSIDPRNPVALSYHEKQHEDSNVRPLKGRRPKHRWRCAAS